MSNRKYRRAENVRLVRQPDGSLVMEEQKAPVSQQSQSPNLPVAPTNPIAQQAPVGPQPQTRRSARSTAKASKKKQKEQEIDDVWKEQIRLKEESERLEVEYRIAKKMAKELKQKMKEQEPLAYGDPVFSDLLSPETKDFVDKIKPIFRRTKDTGLSAVKGAKRTAKKSKVAAKIATNNVRHKRSRKTLLLIAPVLLVVVGGGVLINQKRSSNEAATPEVKSAQTDIKAIELNQTPEFKYLLPKSKTAEQLGGFAKVSPSGSAPAYAYVDKIGATNIRVTQQAFPDAFKADPATKLQSIAKDFNATKLLQIDSVGAYIGKSEKGPQTVIFIKDDILFFIAAEQEVPEVGWVGYISQLNPKE
jgi:hypothetical protein